MTRLEIATPNDLHVHLRQDSRLAMTTHHTGLHFGRALVMPNTNPPVLNGDDVETYRREILRHQIDNASEGMRGFEPLMTIKLVPSTTPEMVRGAKAAGALAGKLYPEGVTTNSSDGVKDIKAMYPIFEAMQDVDMVLSLHGETRTDFCMDREQRFLPILDEILESFPTLRVVVEHITTALTAEYVAKNYTPKLAATITVHHLVLTLDDVVGGMIQPHNFCKPIAKRPEDRTALLEAALSGSPKFFLGTDSAPHAKGTKECSHGCAGVYTAPIAMPILAQVFEEHNALHKLEGFASKFGIDFYKLPPAKGRLILRKEKMRIPEAYGDVVPLWAGREIAWTADRDTTSPQPVEPA